MSTSFRWIDLFAVGVTAICRCKKQLCVPTPQQLAAMQLRNGRNAVAFKAGRQMLHADIYVLPADARVVVSDVDGTVTKSASRAVS